jgi:hypothetical protein
MNDDFPDHVSCVSEAQAVAASVVEESKFSEYVAPTTRATLLKAAPEIFQILFPRFRCSTLLCRRLSNEEILWNLPFVYEQDGIPRNGVLAFVSNRHKTFFDPFRSSPQPDRPGGIDFIKLDIVEFRHEFRQFASLLELAGMEELDLSRKSNLSAEKLCKTE